MSSSDLALYVYLQYNDLKEQPYSHLSSCRVKSNGEEANLETLPNILIILSSQQLGLIFGWAFWQAPAGRPMWLTYAFLVALFLSLILYLIVLRPPSILPDVIHSLGVLLVVGAGLATAALFFVLLFNLNPFPWIRNAAETLGLGQLVNFDTAFDHGLPDAVSANIGVVKVVRADTDADGFDEWVVFYLFDERASNSPIHGAIYDNDRGNPPVIFPYQLQAPDRNYLSEEQVFGPGLVIQALATDHNGPNGSDMPELIIQGLNELTIFRHRNNSDYWDFPRDAPARYQAIGFFRGNGGVSIDLTQGSASYGRVTVTDRNGYERSQLAIRSIYGLLTGPDGNQTYLDPIPPLGGVGMPRVAAPIISTVDFSPTPPGEIFNTPFPEKIVLAFYAATCGVEDDTLCRNTQYNLGWQPGDFLTGDALSAFEAGNPAYFGLSGLSNNQNILVTQLRYHPGLETDADLLETGGGRDVVTGEQGQYSLVDISFSAEGAPSEMRRYEMVLVEGRWKISRAFRLVTSALEASSVGGAEFDGPILTPVPDCQQNIPPAAEANGPYTGLISQGQAPVTFSSAGSSDSDGTIQTYTWDFGDGSAPGSGQSASHDYSIPGVYTVILNIMDNCGAGGQDTTKVTIAIPK